MSDFIKPKNKSIIPFYSRIIRQWYSMVKKVCTKHADKKALLQYFPIAKPPRLSTVLTGNVENIFEFLQQRVSQPFKIFATHRRPNNVDHFNRSGPKNVDAAIFFKPGCHKCPFTRSRRIGRFSVKYNGRVIYTSV